MAKNLKINIKNAQLAGVLKLNKLKKVEAEEKEKEAQAALTSAEKKAHVPEPAAAAPIPAGTVPPSPAEVKPSELKESTKAGEEEKPAPQTSHPAAARHPLGASSVPKAVPKKEEEKPGIKKPAKPPTAVEESKDKKPSGVKEFRDFKTVRRPGSSRSFDSRDRQGLRDEEEGWRKKRPRHKFREEKEQVIRPKSLKVRLPISIKDLAAEMKLKASELIAKLFMQGVILTLNDYLDDETTIQLLGHEFDCEISIDTTEEERIRITGKSIKEEIKESDPSLLIPRPPVIAFMGHVDHGKTSLIDAIRHSKIASGEAGAITQHIGAFKCHTPAGDVTILDTPGHEAFFHMRERGADVTDMVILVIAGDEGIKAQTLEAIVQAKEANVPIVVAVNKCDKPGFNIETIYRQLADQELLPEAWGGTTITIPCSAVTKQGIKELLEMVALQSEVLELRSNPRTRARGTVIESEMHKGLGAVATVLVQNGTLRLGDALVFDTAWGRVKTMHDEHEKEMVEASPSTPAKITGLSGLPEAGSEFIVVKDEKEARELGQKRVEGQKAAQSQLLKRKGLEGVFQDGASIQKKILPLVLRADVQGSLEALKNSLLKILSEKVEINIISMGVGEIGESDIELAAASKATIIGFHTKVEARAESLIREKKVNVKLHNIIYHAVDDVKQLMLALLDKIPKEMDIGSALVKTIFKASQLGVIAGCMVTDGIIKRNCMARLVRNEQMVWKGSVASLKRLKEDVREVSKGFECGILLNNFTDIKEGDIIQAYEVTYLQQTL